eukprot:6205965-Pleurochrysis_carterae.AAC.10
MSLGERLPALALTRGANPCLTLTASLLLHARPTPNVWWVGTLKLVRRAVPPDIVRPCEKSACVPRATVARQEGVYVAYLSSAMNGRLSRDQWGDHPISDIYGNHVWARLGRRCPADHPRELSSLS